MTSTAVAVFDEDDEPQNGESADDRKARVARQSRRMRQAYRDGGLDVLEQFVPGILDAMARSQQLLPRLFDLVDGAITEGNTAALKEATPMLKMLLDENKRLLDRRFGTSVQRTQNDTTLKVQHVSLRGLIAQRAQEKAEPNQTDEHIVDAEVIPE